MPLQLHHWPSSAAQPTLRIPNDQRFPCSRPGLTYRLLDMTLKTAAPTENAAYLFETRGELVVAGVTNLISMPVNVLPLPDNRLKISGTANLRMMDFRIDPPAPRIALGLIQTGNEVKVTFDWVLVKKNTASISANK